MLKLFSVLIIMGQLFFGVFDKKDTRQKAKYYSSYYRNKEYLDVPLEERLRMAEKFYLSYRLRQAEKEFNLDKTLLTGFDVKRIRDIKQRKDKP